MGPREEGGFDGDRYRRVLHVDGSVTLEPWPEELLRKWIDRMGSDMSPKHSDLPMNESGS